MSPILKEPSTWRGIVPLLTSAGVQLSPDMQGAVISAGLAVAGLIGALVSDKSRNER